MSLFSLSLSLQFYHCLLLCAALPVTRNINRYKGLSPIPRSNVFFLDELEHAGRIRPARIFSSHWLSMNIVIVVTT
ncbi:hypothetical protein F4775DRAFT_538143 [Biscogniauxia sp. FL1348]|nr:hypothetical protein F4775DRAFT_538143 [Biscogniauxia sp. FL1348]